MKSPSSGFPQVPRLRLLGVGSLPDQTGADVHLQYRKGWALLGYLAVERGRSHSREQLAGLLWPDLASAAARTNLRQVLNSLQQVFTTLGLCDVLRADKHSIGLIPADPCCELFDIDVLDPLIVEEGDLVERLLETGWRHRGLFLEGISVADSIEFEEWLSFTRDQYLRRELRMMCRLRDRMFALGRRRDAIDLGWRIIRIDGWNEAHHRALMVILASDGAIHEASHVYSELERTLLRQLGCPPSAETKALHAELMQASRS